MNLNKLKSGAGFFKQKTDQSYYILANSVSSMDFELLAINGALVLSLEQFERDICILTDSRSVLEAIRIEESRRLFILNHRPY